MLLLILAWPWWRQKGARRRTRNIGFSWQREALIERHAGNYDLAASEATKALGIDPNYQPARRLLESIRGAIEAKVFASSLVEKNAG